mgnify:CR=1 FL=1
MTDKDRLIELLDNFGDDISFCDICKRPSEDCDACKNEQLADHLLANGVIVPPCKVGTKVYIAYVEHISQVFDGSLLSYSLDAAHLWFNCHYTCGLNIWHPIEDFGKTVFLTKEEAEQALKECEEK